MTAEFASVTENQIDGTAGEQAGTDIRRLWPLDDTCLKHEAGFEPASPA